MNGGLKPRSLAAKRLKARQLASGIGPAKCVPTAAARAHLLRLREMGMSPDSIAVASGVSSAVIDAVIWPGQRSRRILSTTEARILATRFTTDGLSPRARVRATGTIRRIQGLSAIGWSMSEIGRRLDLTGQEIHHITVNRWVFVRTYRLIADLYRDLECHDGPSKYARTVATRNGWLPPAAWDEDTIDDPDAQPQHDAQPGREDQRAEMDRLLDEGWPVEMVAADLGVLVDSVVRKVQRRERGRAA